MTLDITKPVQTRDGRPARILADDFNGSKLVVAITNNKGTSMQTEFISYCNKKGEHIPYRNCDLDIINVPKKPREFWILDGIAYEPYSLIPIKPGDSNVMERSIHVREVLS